MARRRKKTESSNDGKLAAALSASEWQRAVDAMHFSPRQAEIVHSILRGNCDKQISAELGLSVATVRTHLRQIFACHNIDSRVQLVLRIFEIVRNDSIGKASHH